ncbi:MAG: alanine--tRNA ligase-related protein, partial [Patescibacteria group bacterium]
MTHLELRQKFFAFWESKGHVLIPSSSLVPENDPTTLFTGFGMQPLIPYLLGQPHPLGKRLVNIQKCFRGQDIEEVGDNRHDSFFEMMGNWSLGDYFKKDQLTWYLEFLTDVLGFPKGKLYVTCFEGNKEISKDTESEEIWKNLGISQDHIKFYGVDKNWWSRSGTPEQMPVGEIGGPDSEVFYDFGAPIHDGCHPNCNCGRFIEIGNSVFIQYQKQSDGSFKELPQKNVDFGGGLERTLAALNNDPDIFHTDLYTTLLHNIVVENEYQSRVVADHLKAAVFLIADGVIPSNKD